MELKTFIFIGRSGCGKGTQAKLLIDELKLRDSETPIQYLEAGEKFRELIARPNFTGKLAKQITDTGGLQPAFLAIHNWAHLFIENINGNEHLVLDGSPRKLNEAKILHEAFKFYGRSSVFIIYVNVSNKWSLDRLLARGRGDDGRAEIEKRLSWFDTDVLPAIDYFKIQPDVNLFDINGEQTIEKVHKEIMKKIF